jgi:arylformamidase
MRIIDISGPISDNMWRYPEPLPPVSVQPVPSPDWIAYPVYSHQLSLCVQAGTYLETGAHMYPDMRSIDQLTPDQCVLDAIVVHIPRGSLEAITATDLAVAIEQLHVTVESGDAVLVGTGWDTQWSSPRFVQEPPYFTAGAIDWLLKRHIGLLGADTPRFDSPVQPANFFGRFFRADVLLLAPAVQLTAVRPGRSCLLALPLKIVGACASPVRALVYEGLRAEQLRSGSAAR